MAALHRATTPQPHPRASLYLQESSHPRPLQILARALDYPIAVYRSSRYQTSSTQRAMHLYAPRVPLLSAPPPRLVLAPPQTIHLPTHGTPQSKPLPRPFRLTISDITQSLPHTSITCFSSHATRNICEHDNINFVVSHSSPHHHLIVFISRVHLLPPTSLSHRSALSPQSLTHTLSLCHSLTLTHTHTHTLISLFAHRGIHPSSSSAVTGPDPKKRRKEFVVVSKKSSAQLIN